MERERAVGVKSEEKGNGNTKSKKHEKNIIRRGRNGGSIVNYP